MQTLAKLVLSLYSLTAHLREQLLVTVLGYKSVCRHRPTCSEYTKQSIQAEGLVKGSILGFKRVITCW